MVIKKIVRIRRVDLDGDKKVLSAINKIKGINFMFSNALLQKIGIDPQARLGELSDPDIEKLKNAIENPNNLGLPKWLLNKRNDIETGEDMHITGIDFGLAVRQDIMRMQDTRSRKGLRHGAGLKVRGQKTASHPRRGSTVGVMTKKKAALMGKGGEAKDAAATASQDKKAGAAAGAKGAAKASSAKPAAKPEGGKK